MFSDGHDDQRAADWQLQDLLPPDLDEPPASDPATELPTAEAEAPIPDWHIELMRWGTSLLGSFCYIVWSHTLMEKPQPPFEVVLLLSVVGTVLGMLLYHVIRAVRRLPRGGIPPALDGPPAHDPTAQMPAAAGAPASDWETDLSRCLMALLVAFCIGAGLYTVMNKPPPPLKIMVLGDLLFVLIGMLLCRVIRAVRRRPRGG